MRRDDAAQGRAGQPGKVPATGRQPGIGPPGEPLVKFLPVGISKLRQPLVELPRGAEQSAEQVAGRVRAGHALEFGHELVSGRRNTASRSTAVQQIKGPLEHGRGRADAVVPIDLAEHHIAGKNHQFGGRAALVGECQAVAGAIQAKAAQQPLLIEMPAVRPPACRLSRNR